MRRITSASRIAYVSQIVERPPNLSNLELPPADDGVAGGQVAIDDNNTTGRFLKQDFSLKVVSVPPSGDAGASLEAILKEGIQFVILDVPAAVLLEMADATRNANVLLFNAGAPDDRLRDADCRRNVLHIAPSRAMLTDALTQYLMWKRWRDWLLIVGRREGDRLFATALRNSAKKFGAKIVAEKTWEFGPDARRPAQAEVPVFTQGRVRHGDGRGRGRRIRRVSRLPHVAAASCCRHAGADPDELAPDPRTVGSSAAAKPLPEGCGPPNDASGLPGLAVCASDRRGGDADQVKRFRARSRSYMLGESFDLAGFKGQKLTFRGWDQQLRQPILLAAPTALVSVSPQQGYLHPRSPLDTLGVDEPESRCKLN